MLQSLRIRNLALLEEVVLDFAPGFTAVTGETGAGKSILLGALSLLAGERADKTVIRAGAPACEVEAALGLADPTRFDAALAALDLPPCEEGVLILKRSVARDKPGRITVNGSLATLAALQRLGELWIDFHGPGEPRRLLRDGCQLELLDLFGRCAPALATYGAAYRAWRELQARREALVGEARLSPDEVAFLERRLAALDRLELTAEAVATLERDAQRMGRAQELIALAGTVEAGLAGEDGALARLAALVREGRRLEGLDPASKPLADRLASAAIELSDLAAEFASLGRDLQFDPEAAASLEVRVNAWLEARRRYGGDVAAVAAAREELRNRLAAQGDLAGALGRLDREIAAAEQTARKAAAALRALRVRAAAELARAAAKGIAALGFQKAEFRVALGAPGELGPSGDGGCEFLFSPNVGEAPLPLARIASSGELARVMLALKTVLADLDQIPLLVFDEVDANVGGEIGRVVGEKMAGIAVRHQVLCVTHLPQVAAQAANHLVVTKDQSGERAVVTIAPIHENRRARVGELARMLGDRGAKSALAHAEELLRAS